MVLSSAERVCTTSGNRSAGRPRYADESSTPGVARAIVIVEIEPGFADGDDFGSFANTQTVDGRDLFLADMMGMDPDRGIDIGIGAGHRQHRREARQA